MPNQKFGPYVTKSILGRGGMGAVYKAEHSETGEMVAIKVLEGSRGSDPGIRQRFQGEIETLSRLDHPNIVRILGEGSERGELFFTMEIAEGRSLFDLLREKKQIPWPEVVAYTLDICEGLRHAHDRGVIHRDIKPGNLLLTTNGRIKLTDFGIAKQFGGAQITADGGVVGTLDFMAPEQMKGEGTSIRSDLYSLGCVMYSLLAGRPPFFLRSATEGVEITRTQTPPSIRTLAPSTPEELEKIVMRLISADPNKRYASAHALSQFLKDFLSTRKDATVTPAADTEDLIEMDSDEFEVSDGDSRERTVISKPTGAHRLGDVTRIEPPMATDHGDDDLKVAPAEQKTLKSETEINRGWQKGQKDSKYRPIDRPKDDIDTSFEKESGPVWPIAFAFFVVIVFIALGYYIVSRGPNPEDWAKAMVAAYNSGDTSRELEKQVEEFLAKYPKSKESTELESIRSEIAAARVPTRLDRRARIGGEGGLNPLEREFLHLYRLSSVEPREALPKLKALLDLYQPIVKDKSDEEVLRATENEIGRLEKLNAEGEKKTGRYLDEALAAAEKLEKTDSKGARRVYQGIITLYEGRAEYRTQVQRAQEKLNSGAAEKDAKPAESPKGG